MRNKKLKWKKIPFWIWFGIGGVIALSPLLSPLHEYGHMIFGKGRVEMIAWNKTVHHDGLTIEGVMGGLELEFTVGFAATWLFVILGRRHRGWQKFGSASFGYTNITIIEGCWSYDFNDAAPSIGYPTSVVISAWLVHTVLLTVIFWLVFNKIVDP